ncbi:MAG: CDP-diacylglycerol--glycerol-3-phosphate 3-phosphatidyltransferase [Verrucomicrobiota bacterium]
MTTANKITITRILMIPMFVMMAIYYGHGVSNGHPREWQHIATVLLFLLAAASDGIDGYIARRFNQKTQLGVILDPIADKGLLLAAIITLSFSNWTYEFPLWFPVLVITRDAVIVIGTALLHFHLGKVQVKPSWIGKTATAFQMIAISCVLLQFKNTLYFPVALFGQQIEINFLDIPIALAGFFTLISGIGYVMSGIQQLQGSDHGTTNH